MSALFEFVLRLLADCGNGGFVFEITDLEMVGLNVLLIPGYFSRIHFSVFVFCRLRRKGFSDSFRRRISVENKRPIFTNVLQDIYLFRTAATNIRFAKCLGVKTTTKTHCISLQQFV